MDGPARDDDASAPLRATHILVLEDSFFIRMEIESTLLDAGVKAVWACRSVAEALRTLAEQPVAAAILDLRLDGETSLPVARALTDRAIPFFFYTGQLDIGEVRIEWPHCLLVSKPAEPRKIVETVASLLTS